MHQIKTLFKRLITPDERLSSRVVIGGFWVFLLRMVSQVLSLVRTIVLARMLAPDDFGLMGITMVTMSMLETFSQTGFQSALIQKKNNIEDYLDTAWTTLTLRGILLAGLLYFGAPLAAQFYNTPEALPVIRTIALVPILNGLMNIRVIYFKKELEFQKQFLFQLTGTLSDLLVSIVLALALQNVWALVYGMLAGWAARLVLSYIITPYTPRPRIDFGKLKDMYGYGRWIFWTSVFIFLLTEGDDALLGKLLGVTALGFYQMAHRIANLPATEITHVISQITFPAYAKLQDDVPALRAAYLNVLKVTALLTIPAAGGIFILAPELTQLLLGDKWMPAVPAMRVLVIGGAIRSIGATMGPVFQAVGKPEILSRHLAVQVLLVAILIYPLTMTYGIVGTGVSLLIPGFIINSMFATHVIRITGCGRMNFLQAVGFPLLGTLTMVAALAWVKALIPHHDGIVIFALLVLAGMAVYFVFAYFMERYFDYRILALFRSIRSSLPSRG